MKCKNCEKTFDRAKTSSKSKRLTGKKRRLNEINCSKKCSSEWRIKRYKINSPKTSKENNNGIKERK